MKSEELEESTGSGIAVSIVRGLANLLVLATFLFFLFRASGFVHDWTEHDGQGHMATVEDLGLAFGVFAIALALRLALGHWGRRSAPAPPCL